ncbi:hypothetical protein GF377_01510 [candidate division GN15 bacterium]|nr:hypothetical protein [candidate division GN15 bacterium]
MAALLLSLLLAVGIVWPVTDIAARPDISNLKQDAADRWHQQSSQALPRIFYTAHSRGNIRLALANNGTFGTFGQAIADPFTGEQIPSCEYPRNSDLVYLWVGAFWIGAVIDRDTVVSCGSEDFYETAEFWPEVPELGGRFKYGSIDIASDLYDPNVDAYSEEDIFCTYYDTLTNEGLVGRDESDARGHVPLGIQIDQRSMAWSYEYADDFILFDYVIRNISNKRLRKLYIGIWVDGDAFHVTRNDQTGWQDDIVGFRRYYPAPEECGFIDTINIAYHADNDGDPDPRDAPVDWDYRSCRSVLGTRVVRTPSDSLELSFNWWITNYSNAALDFGPRKRGTADDPFRSLGSRLGTPEGDRSKYYVMSHGEFDYDLLTTAVPQTDSGWLPPPPQAEEFAEGFDTRYLLSFGPFDMEPGQSLPVTFAWVGGEDFHVGPTDFVDTWNPNQPGRFYDRLNFSELALNARWASWVYDNPGVDTDGDGYRGKLRVCNETGTPDSMWYEGDGVPDFRGAGPPTAPSIRVVPSVGKLTVRWNGFYSETTRDVFSNIVDFEGYRVYLARDDRPSSFSVLRSYDRENYARLAWREVNGIGQWVRDDVPYTLGELRVEFNDSTFQPLDWPRSNPYEFNDQFYYFEEQDYNQSDLELPGGIRKVYPDAENPGTDSTLWQPEDLVYDYDQPLPKYYEYEYVIEDILPTVPYYVAVTAFDFGSPSVGLSALETQPLNNSVYEYPQTPADSVEADNLNVYVYPNPYRIDADYAQRGFENRSRAVIPDRARRIHFANLPRVCKISIFSLDGDLIREIDHNFPEGGPQSMHNTWDLITRNTQTVVSGMYYWVVESADRTQIGKLVIIK